MECDVPPGMIFNFHGIEWSNAPVAVEDIAAIFRFSFRCLWSLIAKTSPSAIRSKSIAFVEEKEG